jgi:DNA-binding MarR family transcriptional regulator
MTVSKSLKKLVALGFVNRIEHESDTRAKSVMLTDKGIEIVRTLVPIVEGIDAGFFNAATKPEEKQLTAILAKLIRGSQNVSL